MITRKLLNGEIISSASSIMKSKSCKNIHEEFNQKKKIQMPITESIYDKFHFIKANKIKQCTKKLRRLSQYIKTKNKQPIQSFYSIFLKNSVKSFFDRFYLTSSKYNEAASNDSSIPSKTSDQIFNSITQDQIFSTELKQNYLKMEIGSLFKLPQTALELTKYCRNILFLKNITIIKQNSLSEKEQKQTLLAKDLNEHSIQLKKREKLLKEGYYQQIDNYFSFLFTRRHQESIQLNELRNQRITLTFELNKVILLVAKEKIKLDQTIDERNFLIKVQEKIIDFPLIFLAFVEKERKNNYLFDAIKKCESKIKPEAIVSLLHEEKYQKEYEHQRIQFNKNKHKLLQEEIEAHNKIEERYKKYANKLYLPFEYPEDLLKEINNLERQNIVSLSFLEKITDQTDILKIDFIQMKEDNQKNDHYIQNQINIKEKLREDLLMKYNNLVQLKKYMMKRSLFQEKDRQSDKSNKKTKTVSSLHSSTLEYMKYNNIHIEFPIEFTCIYSKLAFIVSKIIKDTNLSDKISSMYKKEELHLFLNSKFNMKNKDLIHSICIKLFKMYEKAVDIILFKQKNFLNDPLTREKTLKAAFERQKATKIQNALEQRTCLQEKRDLEKEKIILKNKKIIYLPKRKIMEKIYITSQKKENNKKEILNKELSFYDYIEYTADRD